MQPFLLHALCSVTFTTAQFSHNEVILLKRVPVMTMSQWML